MVFFKHRLIKTEDYVEDKVFKTILHSKFKQFILCVILPLCIAVLKK